MRHWRVCALHLFHCCCFVHIFLHVCRMPKDGYNIIMPMYSWPVSFPHTREAKRPQYCNVYILKCGILQISFICRFCIGTNIFAEGALGVARHFRSFCAMHHLHFLCLVWVLRCRRTTQSYASRFCVAATAYPCARCTCMNIHCKRP